MSPLRIFFWLTKSSFLCLPFHPPVLAALQISLHCAVEFLCTKQLLNKEDKNTKGEEAHLDLMLLQEEEVGNVKAAGCPRGDGHEIIKFVIPTKEKRKASKVKTAGF